MSDGMKRIRKPTASAAFDNGCKKGGDSMSFAHCDHDETYISLHDCLAERAYLKDGKLGFELRDGFLILPDHPENRLSQTVRTDASRVEYTLYRGESDDVTVYVFEKTFFKRTLRREWPLEKLIKKINRGQCRIEFLYQYRDPFSVILECELHFRKRPYFRECSLKIFVTQTDYAWNVLREDCPW